MSEPDAPEEPHGPGDSAGPELPEREAEEPAKDDASEPAPPGSLLGDATVGKVFGRQLSPEVKKDAIDYLDRPGVKKSMKALNDTLSSRFEAMASPATEAARARLEEQLGERLAPSIEYARQALGDAAARAIQARVEPFVKAASGRAAGYRAPSMMPLPDLSGFESSPAGARADQMDRLAGIMEQQLEQLEIASGVMKYTADQTAESNRLAEIAQTAADRRDRQSTRAVWISIGIAALIGLSQLIISIVDIATPDTEIVYRELAPSSPSAPGSSARPAVE